MYIRTDDDDNIIELIFTGVMPENNGHEVNNIDDEIIKDILNYKYIDGEFVKNEINVYQKNIDFIKDIKISRMSEICNMVIESGIDYNNSHYALKQTDQIELIKLESMLKMDPTSKVFYHADGEKCRQYSNEEFLAISGMALGWITYHRTYFNLLKSEIINMTDVNDVLAVNYGSPLNTEDSETLSMIMDGNVTEFPEVVDTFNYDSLFPSVDLNSIPNFDNNIDGNINDGFIDINTDDNLTYDNISDIIDDSTDDRLTEMYEISNNDSEM